MRTGTRVYLAALLIYLLAWFLPVAAEGSTLADGVLPGWEALLVALEPLWDRDPNDTLFTSATMVLSGLTNLVFLGAVVLMGRRPARRAREASIALLAAGVVNGYWIWLSYSESLALRVGYYAWLGAFLLLAAAAALESPAARPVDQAQ